MRLLVAEDERDLNKIITMKLTSDGYSVDSCYDGEEAVDHLAAADFDGVMTVRFDSPVIAPTPGQTAAVYRDALVLGGGIITE